MKTTLCYITSTEQSDTTYPFHYPVSSNNSEKKF